MRKVCTIILGIFFSLVCTACKQYNLDIDTYLSYWATEVSVADSTVQSVFKSDRDGIPSALSARDLSITLTLSNPQSIPLDMPSAENQQKKIVAFPHLAQAPVLNTDYTLTQSDDGQSLILTYKEVFLQAHEWGEQDLSATITLHAKDGRKFRKPHTVKLKANTPPPTPAAYTVAKTSGTPSYYVLCITVPEADMEKSVSGGLLHKDIACIEVNGTRYPFAVDEAERRFTKPEGDAFIPYTDVAKLSDSDEIPTGGWVLYYRTDAAVQDGATKKDYRFTLVDKKGLVSGVLSASTKPNSPKSEVLQLIKGTVSGSGSGSEADPVIIGTDSTGAAITISSPTENTAIHCTLTAMDSGAVTQETGTSITVQLPLNGAAQKTYKLEYYTDGEGFTATPVKTVYYKLMQGYTVTFDANGGSYPDSSTEASCIALHGNTVSKPHPQPVKSGYGLTGWYHNAACTGAAWNFATPVTGSMTLYAQWTAESSTASYTVEHYQQEIDGSYPTTPTDTDTGLTGTVGAALSTGNGITRKDYTGFEFDTQEPASPVIAADGTTTVRLKYKRKPIPVTFSVQGGNGSLKGGYGTEEKTAVTSAQTITVPYGGTITFTATPADPSQHKVGDWTCIPSEGFTGQSGQQAASLTVKTNTDVRVQFVPLNTLTLTTLEIHGKNASAGSVELPYSVSTVKKENINIAFSGHTNIPFTVTPAELHLTPGVPGNITLDVAASPGNYPAWTRTVSITRSKNNIANVTGFKLNGEAKQDSFATEYRVASTTAEVKDVTFDSSSTGARAEISPAGSTTIPVSTGLMFTITPKAQNDSTKPPITFTVKRKEYTVTYNVGGANGQIQADSSSTSGTGDSIKVEHGESIAFTATPNEGYEVAGWTGVTTTSPDKKGATLSGVTQGQTVTVQFEKKTAINGTEPNAWKLLKKAVEIADNGAVITINGTITATNTEGNSGEIVINKNLTIKKADGATTAVLNANGTVGGKPAHRIFKVTGNGVTLTIKDLTLTGGKAPDTATSEEEKNGGGVYVDSESNLTMTASLIQSCTAAKDGGGIYTKGSTVTMTDSDIKKCEAKRGGAIYASSNESPAPSVHITNGTIGGSDAEANKATGTDIDSGKGGGIFIQGNDSTLMLEGNATLTGNTAEKFGGGVYFDGGTFTMKGSARITPDVNKNDVYLDHLKMIALPDPLTGAAPVARITPALYGTDKYVLTGTSISTNYTKFTVTPEDLSSGNTQDWEINNQGKLVKKVAQGGSIIDPADNTTWGGKTNAWAALKAAVEASDGPERITIKGSVQAGLEDSEITVSRKIEIAGDGNTAALDANGLMRIFTVSTEGKLTLHNLTLKKGYTNNVSHYGGGIYNAGELTILSCEIIENKAQSSGGGGIYIANGGNCTITGSSTRKTVIGKNESPKGAGIQIDGKCTIGEYTVIGGSTANANKGTKYGGGIFISSTGKCMVKSGAEISYNSVTAASGIRTFGGGIYVEADSGKQGELKLEGVSGKPVRIHHNEATHGGGIYVTGTVSMQYTEIKDCTAKYGGGMYLTNNASTTMGNNCEIASCSITESNGGGGGVYVKAAAGKTVTFTMKGNARVTPSINSEKNTPGKNDVYLESRTTIKLEDTLNPAEGTAARITPQVYGTDKYVLSGDLGLGTPANYTKFTVTPESLSGGSTQNWEINNQGNLKKR